MDASNSPGRRLSARYDRTIRRLCRGTVLGLLLGCLSLQAEAAEYRDYTVGQLLKPCEEGDNDARWGAEQEANCEQFINGFTAAIILISDVTHSKVICLPPSGNRPDEVRWAFMRWVYQNYDRIDQPAAVGLMAAIKSSFPCK